MGNYEDLNQNDYDPIITASLDSNEGQAFAGELGQSDSFIDT